MLIPVSHLSHFWRIKPKGTLHVGAHLGEEQEEYRKHGFDPVIWIEAQDELVVKLRSKVTPPSIVIQAVAWNIDDEKLPFKVSNNGQSSSVFDFGSHTTNYPEVFVEEMRLLVSTRLETVLPKEPGANFLNLDIQGAEYEALQGLGELLHSFDYVYSEVNNTEVYSGIHQISEIDKYLDGFGFTRVATIWTGAGWGDALYLKRSWALNQFQSMLKLRMRMGAYAIWVRIMKLSPRQFIPKILRSLVMINRNKSRLRR
jgi:FkbM family methyltransferase